MAAPPDRSNALAGRRIGITAERRADQQVQYVERRGGEGMLAPTLRTLRLSDSPSTGRATDELIEHPPDLVIVQTGQGLRWWLEGLDDEKRRRLLVALGTAELWTRGAKAASACRHAGLQPDWQAESETAAEIVDRLRSSPRRTMRVTVQGDAASDDVTVEACSEIVVRAGGTAIPLDLYRYRLPENEQPARSLIEAALAGAVDAITFTASPAIRHLRDLAASMGRRDELDAVFVDRCAAVVVGPVCAAEAERAGWLRVVEPDVARLLPMLDAMTAELGSRPR